MEHKYFKVITAILAYPEDCIGDFEIVADHGVVLDCRSGFSACLVDAAHSFDEASDSIYERLEISDDDI